MPRVELTAYGPYSPLPLVAPAGPLLAPRVQFRCFLRLPNVLAPRDAVIDTGAPFTIFPEEVWRPLRAGTDFEWLPFAPGFAPPAARTPGWTFTYRFARFLLPVGLHDGRTELHRDGLIAQFADSNPLVSAGSQRLAVAVVGLWGGALEGTSVRVETDAATGRLAGALEW